MPPPYTPLDLEQHSHHRNYSIRLVDVLNEATRNASDRGDEFVRTTHVMDRLLGFVAIQRAMAAVGVNSTDLRVSIREKMKYGDSYDRPQHHRTLKQVLEHAQEREFDRPNKGAVTVYNVLMALVIVPGSRVGEHIKEFCEPVELYQKLCNILDYKGGDRPPNKLRVVAVGRRTK